MVNVVALFRQTQGSLIAALQLNEPTVAALLIAAVQAPCVWVATTVYEPTASCGPKVIGAPVPATGAPVLMAFRSSW